MFPIPRPRKYTKYIRDISEIFGGPLFSEIFSRWKYPYIVLRKNKTKINALIRPIRGI